MPRAVHDGPKRKLTKRKIMSFKLIFWVLMLIWVVFGYFGAPEPGPARYKFWGGNLLLFVLLLILGWEAFGPPVHS